jgi:hypothetical protein
MAGLDNGELLGLSLYMPALRPKYLPWIVLASIGLAIACYFLQYRLGYPFDDTFITFRYAKNLASGFGIVWNPGGPHTEGYTNFLLVLLLAIAQLLRLDLLLAAQWIAILAAIGTSLFGFSIAERLLNRSAAWVAALMLLADPFVWFNAMSAMETNLFVFFIFAVWWAFSRGEQRLAYTFAALATLTRPEGAVAAVIVFAMSYNRATPLMTNVLRAIRDALWFIVPIAIYALGKLWYFGDLLPNSFYVKVIQVQANAHAPRFPGLGAVKTFYIGSALLVVLAALLAWRVRDRRSYVFAIAWIVAMSIVYSASYLLMGNFDRFTFSIEAMLNVLACAAAIALMNKWRNRLAGVLLAVLAVLVTHYELRNGIGYLHAATRSDMNIQYRRTGEAIARIPGHERMLIASSDAGVLPFYSGTQHLDLVGLNTTEIARAHSRDQVLGRIAAAHPAVILVPLYNRSRDTCQLIFRNGHGIIGGSYVEMIRAPWFATYRSVGGLDIGYYTVEFFTDTTSPFYSVLRDDLRDVLLAPADCFY